MHPTLHFLTPPHSCSYLPHETARLEYELVPAFTASAYEQRMSEGWRRFGYAIFRPQCQACQKCQPIRVDVRAFRPNRSQQRARKRNEGSLRLTIGEPTVTRAKLRLYDLYHYYQAHAKGWPSHPPKDAASYRESFVDNPFPTQEWCYYLGEQLVGVGYVDVVPAALSAIYFFYDPAERDRSLGVWNVLSVIDAAAQAGLPHLYLGYYVAGCRSMEYKVGFVPNEVRGIDGVWRPFRT